MKKTWFKGKIESATIKETKETFHQWNMLAEKEVHKQQKLLLAASSNAIPSPSIRTSQSVSAPSLAASTSIVESKPSHYSSAAAAAASSSSAASEAPSANSMDAQPSSSSSSGHLHSRAPHRVSSEHVPPPASPNRHESSEKDHRIRDESKGWLSYMPSFSLPSPPSSSPSHTVSIVVLVLAIIYAHMYFRIVYLEGKVAVLESMLPILAQKL
jgi:hypothetical protein